MKVPLPVKSSSAQVPSRRIASIQVCRGLAAMAVVLAHLHNLELKYFNSNLLGGAQFGVGGVDLFFVISGVVISLVTEGRFGEVSNARHFLYQRITRIYPIYWVYSSFVLVAFLFNPLWINSSGGHHVDVVQSFLLIPTSVPMLLLQGWTLSYEIYFYLLFFLLLLFSTERWALRILVLWGGASLAVHFLVHPAQPMLAVIFNPLLSEFILGCLIYSLYRRIRLHPAAGALLVGVSLVMLGCTILDTNHAHGASQDWIEDFPLTRVLLYGTCSSVFLLGLMELERSNLVRWAAPLISVGDWSYSIYLSHTIVLKAVCSGVARFLPWLGYSIVWVMLVSLPAVLVVGYLSFTFVERPLTALLHRHSPLKLTETDNPQQKRTVASIAS